MKRLDDITFTVPGRPQGKQRHRTKRVGQFMKEYPHPQTVRWEEVVRNTFLALGRRAPEDYGLVVFEAVAFYPYPDSWPEWRKEYARAFALPCGKYHDWDNIGKLACDALQGIAYKNDTHICEGHTWKFYAEAPRTVIRLVYYAALTRGYAAARMRKRSAEKSHG